MNPRERDIAMHSSLPRASIALCNARMGCVRAAWAAPSHRPLLKTNLLDGTPATAGVTRDIQRGSGREERSGKGQPLYRPPHPPNKFA